MIAQFKKTVYFDHNAIIEIVERNIELLPIFDCSEKVNVVASIWNLYEATGSSTIEQALRIVNCLDGKNVSWLQERTFIQAEELKSFIFSNFYSSVYQTANPVRKYFSEAVYTLTRDPGSIIINGVPSEFVKALYTDKNNLNAIEKEKHRIVAALKSLQNSRKNGQFKKTEKQKNRKTEKQKNRKTEKQKNRKTEKQQNYVFFRNLVPRKTPTGAGIDGDKFEQILNYCISNIEFLYESCPSIAVENVLKDIRTSNPKRKPEPQDAADLQHAIPAIAYCDILVTQ